MEDNQATRERDRGGCSGDGGLAGEPDRLSALPDCLLHSIMSFMKARQAVQTCVLSTRWRHLWRSLPCLDIDRHEFKQWGDFENFAINLMQRCNIALLDSFRLCVSEGRAPFFDYINPGDWVIRVINYRAPDPGIRREGLPSSNSWRLKRLHLCKVFLDIRFPEHISSACHPLEDLELQDCRCELRAIASQSLKNMVLKDCSFRELSGITAPALKSLVIDGSERTYDFMLVITAPAVAYLYLDLEEFGDNISINQMPYLDMASIHLWDNGGSGRENEIGHKQFEILCSVSNVTRLVLSDLGQMVLTEEESTTFKEFKNLRNLLMDNCDLSDDCQTLTLFLQNSPNLEKLTLQRCKFSNDFKKKKGMREPNEASSSQCQSLDVKCANLKFTEIIYKDDDVHQLVELLLRISGKLPKNHLKLTKVD